METFATLFLEKDKFPYPLLNNGDKFEIQVALTYGLKSNPKLSNIIKFKQFKHM